MKQRPEAQTDEFQKLVPGLDELETMGLGKLEQQEQAYIIEHRVALEREGGLAGLDEQTYIMEHRDALEREAFLAGLDNDERDEMYGWPTQGNDAPPAQQTVVAPTSFYPSTLQERDLETFLLSKVGKGLHHILHIAETIFLSPEPLDRIMELRQTDESMASRRDLPYDLGVCIPEEIKLTAEHAATFAEVHPFKEFHAPDPLVELGRLVRWLDQLIETGRGGQVHQSSAMEMRWRVSGCKLIAQCQELRRVMIIRDDWAMNCLWMNQTKSLLEAERQRTMVECEARVEDAKAEMYKAQHRAEEEAKARERAKSSWDNVRVLNEAIEAKLEEMPTKADMKDLGNVLLNYMDNESERRRLFLHMLDKLKGSDPVAYEIIRFWMDYPKERGWQVALAKKKGISKQAVNKQWKAVKKRYPKLCSWKGSPVGIGGGPREAEENGQGEE